MPAALARYRRDRASKSHVLSGRFLCAAERIDEMVVGLADGDRVAVALITALDPSSVGPAVDAVRGDPRLTLASIEGPPLAGIDTAVSELSRLDGPRYVEVATQVDDRTLAVLAGAGLGAKARCGGLRAELFPTPEQLAGFIRACVRRALPFKATAGLHHAVRYTDPVTGFTHHGFLNLLVAVAHALAGADPAPALRSHDAGWLVREASQADADGVRAVFVCYGSCSTTEPAQDLIDLGFVTA